LKSDAGLDKRVYNLPTASKVVGMWIEQDAENYILTLHIYVYTTKYKSQLVNNYYGCYDPLQYLLLFSYGQMVGIAVFKKLIL